jgi:predicted RNA-binding protein with TRAM domain
MSNRLFPSVIGSVLVASFVPAAAWAEDAAEVGKSYEVTVVAEVSSPFVGQFGDARIGKTALQIPGAKKGEKYSVTIKSIGSNPFTGLQQAACSFKQIGEERAGECNKPPA